ncbi:MAG: chemotaxis protein CheW [Bdellovibrionales bacterium]|nr:chemotaxis protein CheW [Bdellovibrionales bacterium]
MTNEEIYGSFFLGTSEFALSVRSIQEVVNPPGRYTAVPLGPPYLVGLFNLRGTIVPVIHLRKLLGLAAGGGTDGDSGKIVIVEFDAFCVGLLFDRTGEIFRAEPETKSVFEYAPGTKSVVEGAFKLEDGRRIVQVLSPSRLLELDSVPREALEAKSKDRRAAGKRSRGLRKQCISFVVGDARCALPIESIQEIIKVDRVTESSLSSDYCIGTIDLRGSVVPVVDFASLLGYRTADRDESATRGDRRIIVMRFESEFFGFLVDSVENIVSFFREELVSFPAIGNRRSELFLGCICRDSGGEILLLNHGTLLSNDELREITRGHSAIYHAKASRTDQGAKGARKTYVTFRIEDLFAVEISQIREIIEYPKTLLHPPGMPAHCRGMLNLRGDLVTIIDSRSVYRMTAWEEGSTKVLIFKQDETRYGLIVDSVEAIRTFSESDKIRVPDILYKSGPGSVGEDVKEAMQVRSEGEGDATLMILDPAAVYARVSVKAA